MRRRELRRLVLIGTAIVVIAVCGVVLYFFRNQAAALFSLTQTVLNILGVGLVTLIMGCAALYRRLRRRMPVRLPSHVAFRVGEWTPAVPFVMADGVDLDKPRVLGPGEMEFRVEESSFVIPPELAREREAIVAAYSARTLSQLTDGTVARLESFSLLRTPGDEHPNWLLTFSPLSYFDFVCTNLALTGSVRLAALPREALAALSEHRRRVDGIPLSFHDSLAETRLGNGLTVHVNIIDADNNLLVGRRPANLSVFPSKLVASATGAVAWTDRMAAELPPDPFLAAVREAYEETGIRLARRDIRFFALGMQADQRHPLLLGEARVDGRLGELLRLGKDAWENERFYYLDLDNLAVCAAVLVYGDWLPASAVGVCLTLLRQYGYKRVAEALDGARKDHYRRWLARGEPRRGFGRRHVG